MVMETEKFIGEYSIVLDLGNFIAGDDYKVQVNEFDVSTSCQVDYCVVIYGDGVIGRFSKFKVDGPGVVFGCAVRNSDGVDIIIMRNVMIVGCEYGGEGIVESVSMRCDFFDIVGDSEECVRLSEMVRKNSEKMLRRERDRMVSFDNF